MKYKVEIHDCKNPQSQRPVDSFTVDAITAEEAQDKAATIAEERKPKISRLIVIKKDEE